MTVLRASMCRVRYVRVARNEVNGVAAAKASLLAGASGASLRAATPDCLLAGFVPASAPQARPVRPRIQAGLAASGFARGQQRFWMPPKSDERPPLSAASTRLFAPNTHHPPAACITTPSPPAQRPTTPLTQTPRRPQTTTTWYALSSPLHPTSGSRYPALPAKQTSCGRKERPRPRTHWYTGSADRGCARRPIH